MPLDENPQVQSGRKQIFSGLTDVNVRRAGGILAALLTGVAVLFHFCSVWFAGALWRDEVGLVNISLLPTWKEVFAGLMFDHCPIVFPALVRFWSDLGLAGDTGLRILGGLIALALLASFWVASRTMGKGLPLLALSVAALNPFVIRYSESLRAYGLGTTLIILTMVLVWRFLEKPGWCSWLLAALMALLSTQTLYQNACWLLAICIGGVAVALRRRHLRNAATVLAIGLPSALSLLPYVQPIQNSQSWWMLTRTEVTLAIVMGDLGRFTGSLLFVWLLLVFLAAACGIGALRLPADRTGARSDLPLFASITMVLAIVGFAWFIKMGHQSTKIWYYFPLLCFTILCCDLILPRLHRSFKIGVLMIAAGCLALTSIRAVIWRQTNVDTTAAVIAEQAVPGDLVVVNPWYYGVSFQRYYHGAAPWITVPPIADVRYHRFDLFKQQMQKLQATAPVLEQMERTLRSGHRVFLLGRMPAYDPTQKPKEPPVAPSKELGWDISSYAMIWGCQVIYFLQTHATSTQNYVESADALPVNRFEDMRLITLSGWGTNSISVAPPRQP